MVQTKFGAGQRVAIIRTGAFSAPPGAYRVVTALPPEGGAQRYRVRNENEAFDRVLDEARMEAVSYE